MTDPLEIERKFHVKNFTPDLVPKEATVATIEQTYLSSRDEWERRVRMWHEGGETTYFYAEKKHTETFGERIEREKEITQEEYEALLQERDPERQTVHKVRHTFVYEGHTLEVDVYTAQAEGLVVVEVELEHMDEEIVFPPGWDLEEVTSDKRFSNREIARNGFEALS